MTDKEGTEILDHEQSENSNNLNVCPDSITKTNESSGSSCETKTLSKRAQKRKDRCQKLKILQKEKKKQKRENNPPGDLNFNDDCLNETEYYIENGLRKVYPYYFTFKTHAKGRWVGRSILDVCLEEFRYTSSAGYKNHMSSGKLTVNGNVVDAGYILKNNDYVENVIHRHEMHVQAEPIHILHDDQDVLVINKPCSIPVHPCGRYRHNSITFILGKDYGYKNLRSIHRLDRLTSGVLIFAKNDAKCKELLKSLQSHDLQKEYICKVTGEFPLGKISVSEPLKCLSPKLGLHKVDAAGKAAHTEMVRVSYKDNTSIVKCIPRTGRTHQIRVHLQWLGYPIVNDPMYNTPAWGPYTGKAGQYGKTEEELINDLSAYHHPDWHVKSAETGDQENIESANNVTSNDGSVNNGDSSMPDEPLLKKIKLSKQIEIQNDKDNDFTQATCDGISESTYDGSRHEIDADCQYCLVQARDPELADLQMYLHAWRYTGPDWQYQAPWPAWAEQQETS